MTTEEQMRIIENWTYSFFVNEPGSWDYSDSLFTEGDGWLGHMVYYSYGPNTFSTSQYIGPYPDEASLIQESYNRVHDMVWGLMYDI